MLVGKGIIIIKLSQVTRQLSSSVKLPNNYQAQSSYQTIIKVSQVTKQLSSSVKLPVNQFAGNASTSKTCTSCCPRPGHWLPTPCPLGSGLATVTSLWDLVPTLRQGWWRMPRSPTGPPLVALRASYST